MDKLPEFLVRAKVSTYAANGEDGEILGEGGSKIFGYSEGVWRYEDRYFGFDPFIGEEIVWQSGQPVWGMNYYGRIFSGSPIAAPEIYAFLKSALSQVKADLPFRGPEEFMSGIMRYVNEVQGTVETFSGVEAIYRGGIQVYELNYHGGIIKSRE